MGCNVQEIVGLMEKIAPVSLAESWDNVGLLVGDLETSVERLMVCLEVTPQVILEAVDRKVNMIVCHHPVIFKPVKNLVRQSLGGNLLFPLIQNNIAVYCAHTNLDRASGGVDDTLAEVLQLKNIRPLTEEPGSGYYKVVVFIPRGHEDKVMDAMVEAGAGWIGNYSHCTFQTKGLGTFKPLEGTHPFIGQQGKVEYVDEVRLETIVPKERLDDVVKAMLQAHPYEEVAYDLYALANEDRIPGFGRIGELAKSMSLGEYSKHVKKILGASRVDVIGELDSKIQLAASCAGAGSDFLMDAQKAGADVFITGEMKYHDAVDAKALGINVIIAGHYHTEAPVVERLITCLQNSLNSLQYIIEVIPSNMQKDPYSVHWE